MTIVFTAVALAMAQAPAAPVDHSAHSPAQLAQHAQHQQGQNQGHAEMMKHCHEMMAKMHKSIHEGHGGQPGTQADQHKDHSGH